MATFVTYNPDGTLAGIYRAGNIDASAAIAANAAPLGGGALQVDPGHAAIADPAHWCVASGALAPAKTLTAVTPDAANTGSVQITLTGENLGTGYTLEVVAPDGTAQTVTPSTATASSAAATVALDKTGTHTAQLVYGNGVKSTPVTFSVQAAS